MKVFSLFVMTALLPIIAIGGLAFVMSYIMAKMIDLGITKAPVPVEIDQTPQRPR